MSPGAKAMSGARCRTLYPFSGERHGQGLRFAAGELITLLQVPDGGWWEGEKEDGLRGWFPASYVQLLEVRGEGPGWETGARVYLLPAPGRREPPSPEGRPGGCRSAPDPEPRAPGGGRGGGRPSVRGQRGARPPSAPGAGPPEHIATAPRKQELVASGSSGAGGLAGAFRRWPGRRRAAESRSLGRRMEDRDRKSGTAWAPEPRACRPVDGCAAAGQAAWSPRGRPLSGQLSLAGHQPKPRQQA